MLASAEVGTLITALGTGIGRDEYNPDKLRYHRIIIMTDADVDGSHIRTLLLTFFYRQMPELIERGHIYIGLPPLYKIKQGKQEMYLKDDAALNAYLANSAVENAGLIPAEGEPPITGEALEKLLLSFAGARDAIARNAHRYDAILLESLIDFTPLDMEHLSQNIDERHELDALEAKLNRGGIGSARYALKLQAATEQRPAALLVHAQAHGRGTDPGAAAVRIRDRRTARRCARRRAVLHGLIRDGAQIVRGNKTQPISQLRRGAGLVAGRSQEGPQHPALQGPGRNEPGTAVGHHGQSGYAAPAAGAHRGRGGRRPDLHHADGRRGRAAPRIHRGTTR